MEGKLSTTALRGRAARRGFSLLEFEVAMVLLGIALAGLYPLVVVESRGVEQLDGRLPPGRTFYLLPSDDQWVRKLGASAEMSTTDRDPPAPPPEYLVDNVDSGYTDEGTWSTHSDAGTLNGSCRLHEPTTDDNGNGKDKGKGKGHKSSDVALWEFNNLPSGWYEALVTWSADAGRSQHAGYTIYNGSTSASSVTADQRNDPGGEVHNGRPWQSLAVIWIDSSATVQLTAQADGSVSADAARMVPARNTVHVSSFRRDAAAETIRVEVTLDLKVPQ